MQVTIKDTLRAGALEESRLYQRIRTLVIRMLNIVNEEIQQTVDAKSLSLNVCMQTPQQVGTFKCGPGFLCVLQ